MTVPDENDTPTNALVSELRGAVAAGLDRWNPDRYRSSLYRVYCDADQIIAGDTVSELGYALPTLDDLAPHMERAAQDRAAREAAAAE